MPVNHTETTASPGETVVDALPSRVAVTGSKLLRLPAVTARVGMRRTSVYGLIKAGKFPAPVKIGKASAWLDDEITQWIQNLKNEREAAKSP